MFALSLYTLKAKLQSLFNQLPLPQVSAIILAAGLSRRMGKDNKLFLPFGDKTILESTTEQVRASQVVETVIITSKLSHDRLKHYRCGDTKVIGNPHYESGMTSSIQSGIVGASSESIGYMICLGDQPKITTGIYDQLILAFAAAYDGDQKAIVLPFHDGKKGNPVIFSSFYRDQILKHKETEGCKEIVQQHRQHVVKVGITSPFVLQDVDTPSDYEKLKS